MCVSVCVCVWMLSKLNLRKKRNAMNEFLWINSIKMLALASMPIRKCVCVCIEFVVAGLWWIHAYMLRTHIPYNKIYSLMYIICIFYHIITHSAISGTKKRIHSSKLSINANLFECTHTHSSIRTERIVYDGMMHLG